MRQAQLHRMRRIIRELIDMLPEERKNSPRVKELVGWSCTTTMHLVEINAQPIEGETNGLPMVREALTALALAVFVSGILGVLIYLGADALMEFVFL